MREEHHRAMVILRFKIRSKPEWNDNVMATLAEIVPTARATEVHRAMALFAESLAAPPERTIFDASPDLTLV
jgi:hypothetical protein